MTTSRRWSLGLKSDENRVEAVKGESVFWVSWHWKTWNWESFDGNWGKKETDLTDSSSGPRFLFSITSTGINSGPFGIRQVPATVACSIPRLTSAEAYEPFSVTAPQGHPTAVPATALFKILRHSRRGAVAATCL